MNIGAQLDSPLATSEDLIDVVTNVRYDNYNARKTVGIDITHF